jgi:hypothetical protein
MSTFLPPHNYDASTAATISVYQPQSKVIPLTAPIPGGIPVASPGQQLIGTVGLWVNGVLGYNYQLTRNGLPFQTGPWSDGPLYTLQLSDVGSVIALVIIAINKSGAGPVAKSMPILVAGTLHVPVNITPPVIIGSSLPVPVLVTPPMIV